MTRMWIKRLFGAVAFLVGLTLAGWFLYNQIWPTESFKRNFHSLYQLIPALACLYIGWQWMRYEGKSITEVSDLDLDGPELREATRLAHANMRTFLAHVEQGGDGAFIKFPLTTPQGLIEHIWGYVHYHKDGVFNITLANQPIDEQQSTEGRSNVPLKEVEDWQIMNPDGTMRGAYSVIALFKHHEAKGLKLSPRMRKEKAQLLEAI